MNSTETIKNKATEAVGNSTLMSRLPAHRNMAFASE